MTFFSILLLNLGTIINKEIIIVRSEQYDKII